MLTCSETRVFAEIIPLRNYFLINFSSTFIFIIYRERDLHFPPPHGAFVNILFTDRKSLPNKGNTHQKPWIGHAELAEVLLSTFHRESPPQTSGAGCGTESNRWKKPPPPQLNKFRLNLTLYSIKDYRYAQLLPC